MKAIFLDRDGVINIDTGYVYKIEDFKFVDGIFDVLKYLQDKGFVFFIVTNQSGIGRGYYSIEDFLKLTDYMINIFNQNNINILEVKFCPHKPEDNCDCRKPKTKLVEDILSNYKIDIKNSFFIGDKESDIICGQNVGLKTIYIGKDKTKANYKIDHILKIKEII